MPNMNADAERMRAASASIPRIMLPVQERISDEERQRRRVLFELTMRLREENGKIDIPTYELVREGRDE